MAEPAPSIHVFYATFAGTAEGFANALVRECGAAGLAARCANLKDFAPHDFRLMHTAVFIVATHYEGESPDDANEFRSWILDARADKSVFAAKRVALFGLGDKSYDHFNQFGRDVEAFLRAAGAAFITDPAFGDDEHGNIEADFLQWKDALLPALRAAATPAPPTAAPDPVTFRLNESFAAEGNERAVTSHYERLLAARTGAIVSVEDARAVSTEQLRTLEVWVELPEGVEYAAADNIMFFAPNSPFCVQQIADYYRLAVEDRLFVNPRTAHRLPFASGTPALFVLEQLVDLHGPLR